MAKQIGFTQCRIILGQAYSGASEKIVDERQYKLKFPSSGGNKLTALFNTNSCISEHLGRSIFNFLGGEAQKAMPNPFLE